MTIISSEYQHWLGELKQRIRQNQIKAAVKVNTVLLQLYWDLGKDIVEKQKNARWGDGLLKQISQDLMTEFPEMSGFSVRNLQLICKWHSFYNQGLTNAKQLVSHLQQDFFSVPWGHHILIMQRCKDMDNLMRTPGDNPTIGLLICKDKNDIVAEYTLRNIESPIGVSSVQIYDQLTADYKSSLPTIEEIEAQFKDKKEE